MMISARIRSSLRCLLAKPMRDQLLGKPNFASGDYEKTATPFLPISAPFNGALKRPTPKANFLAPAKALRDGDGARKPKP
jgi:hypothetical protein